MAFHLPLSLLAALGIFCVSIRATSGPGWVSLPLIGPDAIDKFGDILYHASNLLVGTPPATGSPVINIWSYVLGVSSSNCVFCPGSNLFDTRLSSTYQTNNQPWNNSTSEVGGILARDTVSFGGVLTSENNSFSLLEHMTFDYLPRMADGHLGLWVDPRNETRRQEHILTRLHSSGQLLNPVVGLRMGRTPQTSHMTIGALDPNDFDGTINWVPTETPDASWILPLAIKLDGFRGFNNTFLPSSGSDPILAYLDSLALSVVVPDVQTYMAEVGYRGPADVSPSPNDRLFGYRCNETGGAYAHLSVDINGVNYQVDSQDNLIENSPEDYCTAWISGYSAAEANATVKSALGLTFLRSVYLAYRFPTPDCPTAYYGFAFQKGANRTSSVIAQQPRSTPAGGSQCLSLTTPKSTPSISAPPKPPADMFLSETSYSIWGRPDEKQVKLKGVEYMQAAARL